MPPDLTFENLVEAYYKDLYRFAYSLTHSEFDAADLVQETFYTWAIKGHQLRDDANVKSWLFTSLHRLFLQIVRKQTRFPHQELDETVSDLPAPDPAAIQSMDSRTLMESIGRIEENYRAPLVLYYMEDLAYKEIANILEIPLGTVQSRISRGKAMLYTLLTRGPSSRGIAGGADE